MTTIVDRDLEVRVYDGAGLGRQWSRPIHIDARVEQTDRRRPNKARVTIYNLSPDSVTWIESQGETLEIWIGTMLYRGDIRQVRTKITTPDQKTEIECGDGSRAYRTGSVDRAYAPGSTSTQVIDDIARLIGLPVDVIGTLPSVDYEGGYYVSGQIVDALEEITQTLGVTWSIQDGVIQIVAPDAPTSGGAVFLRPGAGLIGSPERTDKGIRLKCILRPELRPGRLFRLESKFVSGWFRTKVVKHSAVSDGLKWETDVEARDP